MPMHDDQLDVDGAVASRLVADQFPQWAGLPVRVLSTSGTVNTIVRIGSELAARFPLHGGDADEVGRTLQDEHRNARWLHDCCPCPSPRPVALGGPGAGYPLPWSVQTWVPGDPVTSTSHAASSPFAAGLVTLVSALRSVETRGATFAGEGRGGHLPDHDEWMGECFERSETLLTVATLRSVWSQLRALPRAGADVMSHGDLTPDNLLVDGERLAGVLDGGGFAAADPALDLVAAWHLLDATRRAQVRSGLGCDEVEWHRGTAWAFQQAMGAVWYYLETNPGMARMGLVTLTRIVEDLRPGAPVAPCSSRVWRVLDEST